MHESTFKYTLAQLSAIVAQVSVLLSNKHIVALGGPLGAGKTTLVKELLRFYGVTEDVVSPTFNYVNSYTNQQGKKFFHFDLYRIPSTQNFLAAGFDEYLHIPNSMVIIEWPEIIEPLLKENAVWLMLDYLDAEHRSLIVQETAP